MWLFKKRRVPAYCMMFVIILLSTLPAEVVGNIMKLIFGPSNGKSSLPIDKFIHFTIYSLLGFSYAWAISSKKWLASPRTYFALVIVLAAIFGSFDENYQRFMAQGRDFEIADIAADIAGGLTGALIFLWRGLVLKTRLKKFLFKNA